MKKTFPRIRRYKMKIAFIHYHLKTGGVTSVLRQQLESIQDICDTLVFTGDPTDDPFPADIVHIPGLGYTEQDTESVIPDEIADSVFKAIYTKWPQGCDLIHVHNPTLSKNIDFL